MISIEQLYQYYQQTNTVQIDSRKVSKGNLFFALRGATDGNQYAAKAIEQGASYAVIDNPQYQEGEQYLLVDNALETLQELARYHRKQLAIACIAITGSNGKTTTKELLSAVLSTTYKVQATKGNYNNHIGVPLTLLSLPTDLEMAVVEMGANHQHEINQLCSIALPNFGLITNIGHAHLEGFGGIEGVQKGKGELFEFLEASGGRVFINLNDERVTNVGYYIQKASTYGSERWAKTYGKIQAESASPFLKVRWYPKKGRNLDSDLGPIDIQTQLIGVYNLDNVLAAIAVGAHFKVAAADIKKAIESYTPKNNRSQVIEVGSNTFILDAYNANLSSMKAALHNFAAIENTQKVVLLGDMLELGEYSESAHQEVVLLLKDMDLDRVVLIGEEFGKVKNEINCFYFVSSEEAKTWYQAQQFSNTYFLMKGSRGIALEKILQ